MLIILHITRALGWKENLQESDLKPSHTFVFIGVHFDLLRGLRFPPIERYQASLFQINHILQQTSVTLREWMFLLSRLQSIADHVLQGRLITRPLHVFINSLVSSRRDSTGHRRSMRAISLRYINLRNFKTPWGWAATQGHRLLRTSEILLAVEYRCVLYLLSTAEKT